MAGKKKTIPAGRALIRTGPRRLAIRAASYDAAGAGRRSKGWTATGLGPNAILSLDADVLRRRSHDLLRQNPWAFSGVESFVANCVGTGIKPHCRASDADFRGAVAKAWPHWVADADAAGVTDFYGLQALTVRALVEGGECFLRLRDRRPEDGLTVPLQLQILEAEHVPANLNGLLSNGNILRSGIEFDLIGRRVAYWMYRTHPGEALMDGLGGSLQPVRVPADSVLHIFRPLRPGQIRGEPWMARVLIRLHELDIYDDALLVKQQVAALLTGFITSAQDNLTGMWGQTDPDAQGVSIAGLEPGLMQVLDPGQEVSFSDPPTVSGEADFLNHQLRGSAAGLSVPVANMTGDLSNVNFSSIRAGIIEFRRRCEMFINSVMAYQFCRPIWERWMLLGVLNGELPAPTYLADPRDCLRAKWIGQGWQWVDPLKEVEASIGAVRSGFKSRDQVITELGDDPEMVDQSIADGNARADRLGLILDSDPRKTARTGLVQKTDPNAPADGGSA